jgi:NADH:ubiquinone oxidoreductase subunit E
MTLLHVKVCTGHSCSERFSSFIEKRLQADKEFYKYGDDVEIETCLCQWRCKEGPTVVYGNDVQVGQNPVKASEILRKKIAEARKKITSKK